MTIAEFFVTLGVKGEGSAKREISGVDKALKDVKSTSLEVKAAIVGVIYGLERMMSQSAKTGAGLETFAHFTGLSLELLQKWQYAGRQFNASAEDVESAIKGVQGAMAQMRMTGQAPSGLTFLASEVGLVDEKLDDAFYMMGKLQEFAKKVPGAIGNQVLQSFGLSDKIIAAMRQNAFNEDAFSKAPIYSEKQAESLQRANAAFGNLWDRIQKRFGNFTAQNGTAIISNIDKLASSFMGLSQAILDAANKFKLFDLLGQSVAGWVMILDAMSGKKKLKLDVSPEGLKLFFKGLQMDEQEEFERQMKEANPDWRPEDSVFQRILHPTTPKIPTGEGKPGANMNFEQNIYFENSDKPHENASAQKNATAQALRQMQVGQVS